MDKPNKCKNCQWYGKPYWSIINPCDNCPNKNDNITIITIGDVPPIQEYLTEEEIKNAMTNKSIFEITLEEKDKEISRLNNIIDELEKSAKEIVRVGKNKGYQYVENLNELKTKEEIYDFIEFYYGLYLLEQLDKLKELKEDN